MEFGNAMCYVNSLMPGSDAKPGRKHAHKVPMEMFGVGRQAANIHISNHDRRMLRRNHSKRMTPGYAIIVGAILALPDRDD